MSRAVYWEGYLWAVIAAVLCTAAGFLMTPRFDPVNVAMVYLLAVVVVALRFSRGAAVTASVLCVAAFDFFFIPPQGTFTVDDPQYLLTFGIMLAVALVISHLTGSVRREADARARLAVEAETERIRNVLLASISHDLRTPLAVMSGASSSLAERGESIDPAERAALARSIYEYSREMTDHVEKVLQMTRLEMGAIELHRDWASIGEIAGAVLERLRERLSGRLVMVEVPDDLPLVRVDAALVEQALGNLLDNAVRHTTPDTVVRLRARLEGPELEVSVEDFGTGLEESEFRRVFAKFEHGSMEASRGGMGLGLAICRSIVALHAGRTWVERPPGGGTAFRLTLPIETAPRGPAEGAS